MDQRANSVRAVQLRLVAARLGNNSRRHRVLSYEKGGLDESSLPCALLLFVALGARASDVSGEWIGTVEMKSPDGQTATAPFWAKVRQSGQEISGTAGGGDSDAAAEIRNGSIDRDGKKLTFQLMDAHAVSYTATLLGMVRIGSKGHSTSRSRTVRP